MYEIFVFQLIKNCRKTKEFFGSFLIIQNNYSIMIFSFHFLSKQNFTIEFSHFPQSFYFLPNGFLSILFCFRRCNSLRNLVQAIQVRAL